jgi:hypothetical protein
MAAAHFIASVAAEPEQTEFEGNHSVGRITPGKRRSIRYSLPQQSW